MTAIHSASRTLAAAAVMAFAIGGLSSRVDAQTKANNAGGTKLAGQSAEHRNDGRGQSTTPQTPFTATVGPMGPMGPEGPMGPAGPTGPTGATGATGAKGADGSDGADGAQGVAGAVGPAGSQGPQGATGATGPAGADGADGARGPTGAQGLQGVEGPQGPPGELVQAEPTLAFGAGVFTHYTDPTWVLESFNSGGTLQLRRTAEASAPNPPNQAPVNYLVFGIMHPQGCTGNTSINTANGGMKQAFRFADDPPDALTAPLCLEGSFAIVSVQDQAKRTELRCTRISSSTVVCQKVN